MYEPRFQPFQSGLGVRVSLSRLTFQLKVGADPEDDLRRGLLIRSIIDDPANLPAGRVIDPKTIENKNAGPAGCVLMVDSNRKSGHGATASRRP